MKLMTISSSVQSDTSSIKEVIRETADGEPVAVQIVKRSIKSSKTISTKLSKKSSVNRFTTWLQKYKMRM